VVFVKNASMVNGAMFHPIVLVLIALEASV
jgi:hypothetical protein